MAKIPMLLPTDGTQGDDKYYTIIPGSTTGVDIAKQAVAGSFIALTAVASGIGYLKVQDIDGNPFRIITTDHPDGG